MDFLKILALLVCLLVASASATMTSHRTVASAAPPSLHKHLHDVKKLKKSVVRLYKTHVLDEGSKGDTGDSDANKQYKTRRAHLEKTV